MPANRQCSLWSFMCQRVEAMLSTFGRCTQLEPNSSQQSGDDLGSLHAGILSLVLHAETFVVDSEAAKYGRIQIVDMNRGNKIRNTLAVCKTVNPILPSLDGESGQMRYLTAPRISP